ncbi:MAG: signal peptidase I [Clostridia bacterium]|nr:signal peptidase I [Clostridia bacterium]
MDENKEINEVQEEQQEPKKEKLTLDQSMVEIVSVLSTSIIAIMLIFTFVFRIVGVVGPSMQQTLHEGDWLLVSAFSAKHDRGDIVIITQPNEISGMQSEPIVKRIIAVAGDKLDIDFETASVYVNDKKIDEPYLNTPTTDDEGGYTYPLTIPEGMVFVMGDNRQHSTDSRSPLIGLIDERYILGQVRFRFSPFNQMKFFSDYHYE